MAIIKERGTITFKSDVQSGVSARGTNWYRQTVVVDIQGFSGSYRKLALSVTGDLVQDLQNYAVGQQVDVHYSVKAREYQGRWYNDVDLYKIERVTEEASPAPNIPASAEGEGDLPF